MSSNEILMEIHRIGKALRVSAMDVGTGTEIVFQAPSSTSHAELKKLALSKMRYVLKKMSGTGGQNSGGKGQK
jgi:hypothetical protein